MRAYYNEIDPYAAQWLRNLIAAGHVTPGEVDQRSILDVRPDDLVGFERCHFFAGIGVWDHALKLAGWPEGRQVWTGSCPCQPFSAAGKRGGTADERHLWPAFFHLIEQRGPATVLGEQVASKDGLDWLDLVQADLEGAGYDVGATDLCAAGVGAPHIRQRFWFVANTNKQRHDGGGARGAGWDELADSCGARIVAVTAEPGSQGRLAARERPDAQRATVERGGSAGFMGYSDPSGWGRSEKRDERSKTGQPTPCGSDPDRSGLGIGHNGGPSLTFWSECDWIPCRDGKARPVEPGTFPLAHGAPARVGRLRAYGNAIVAEAAIAFIEAVMQVRP